MKEWVFVVEMISQWRTSEKRINGIRLAGGERKQVEYAIPLSEEEIDKMGRQITDMPTVTAYDQPPKIVSLWFRKFVLPGSDYTEVKVHQGHEMVKKPEEKDSV